MLSTSAVLDLHISSHPTQPHSIIAKYNIKPKLIPFFFFFRNILTDYRTYPHKRKVSNNSWKVRAYDIYARVGVVDVSKIERVSAA